MLSKVEVDSGGLLCTLLTVLFVALKLLGKIDWSWWWVLSPIWLPLVVVLGIVLFVGILLALAGRLA